MDKQQEQLNTLKKTIDDHIVESTYYRKAVAEEKDKMSEQLNTLEKKIDMLLEVYTAANLIKKFIIGLIAFTGTVTAMIYSWLHILKKS